MNAVRAAFAVAVFVLSLDVVLAFWNITRLAELARWVSHTHEVLGRLDDLLSAVDDSVGVSRGFELSGAERLHGQTIESIQATIADVERLIFDHTDEQRRRLAAVRRDTNGLVPFQRRMMEVARTQGPGAALSVYSSGYGELINRIRQNIAEMKVDERTVLSRRQEEERRRARISAVVLIVGLIFSFTILFTAYYGLEREIKRRRSYENRLVRLNRLYALLSQANQTIVRVQKREQLFPEVCRVAVEHGQFAMAFVGELAPGSNYIKPIAWWGREDGYLQQIRISVADEDIGWGPTGTALREGRHFVCNDVANDEGMRPWRDEALKRGYISIAAFPITVQGELRGNFTVFADQPGLFDDETLRVLDEVASDLSFALQTIEQEEQRRIVEQAVKRQAEILDQVHDSIITTNLSGYVQKWNKGAEKLFGYTEAEAIGSHISFIYPEDGLNQPLLANGADEAEIRMRKRSGDEFYVHVSLSPLRGEHDAPVGMIMYSIDVTQRRNAESEVRRLNEELERRIVERTAQLAKANSQLADSNEELARASRMKSEFLARMSHEFRTPLNSIVGFSDLLEEASEGPLPDTYRDYIRHVQEGAHHLLALVNDILDLSRIEAGRIELRHECFESGGAISEVLSVTKPLAEMKGIDLRNEVYSSLHVFADRTRFKQILYNLISNAVKFTPSKGVVRLSAETDYGEIRFTVTDTGIGIPATEHAAIFREFHQVGPASSGVKEGAGLGLAITKRLVELHGGRVWVESSPGDGSRFFFTMPAGSSGENGRANQDNGYTRDA